MVAVMQPSSLEHLIQLFARLPGLGPRSARRLVLHLIKQRTALMRPLAAQLTTVLDNIHVCSACGNVDVQDPCQICRDPRRQRTLMCVVADVADLWALERAGIFRGQYHVLGGILSAIDGVAPEDLRLEQLARRTAGDNVQEVILALGATVEGQTTAHYIADQLQAGGIKISRLAHGVPVGGELDYLDEGTLTAAMNARQAL